MNNLKEKTCYNIKVKIEKKDSLVFLAYLILVLAFFFKFLNGTQIFAFKDLSRYFYPLRYLMVEQVRAGHLPLWNPYIFCGYPLLATLQVGFFYPLTLIYYLLPFNLAFNYYIILHYFLAAVFMYLLLVHYQLKRAAAFLGGIVFAFSGYLLSVSNMNTTLTSVIWLPLLLLFFDRLMKKMNIKDILIITLLLALQFLGGEPTIIYLTWLLLVAYATVFSGSWRALWQSLIGLMVASLSMLGLVAIQLFPLIELIRLSERLVINAYNFVTMRSFPPLELITFIFPYFFGNLSKMGEYAQTLLGNNSQDWLISPYLGILPLIFVFLSFKEDRKRSIFFAGVAFISLILAFGKYTPIYQMFYCLMPGIAMIRYPVKYLFLTTFGLTLLASFGFEHLLKICQSKKDEGLFFLKIISLLVVVLMALLIVGFFVRQPLYLCLSQKYPASTPAYFYIVLARIMEFDLISFFNTVVYLLAFFSIAVLAYFNKIKRWIFSTLIILLVIADLFANTSPIAVSVGDWVMKDAPPNYKYLMKEKDLYRMLYTTEIESQNRLIYGADYERAIFVSKDHFAANWHIPYHFYDFYGYESILPFKLTSLYFANFSEAKLEANLDKLSLFNIKYLITSKKMNLKGLKLLSHNQGTNYETYIYENKKVLPRAYVFPGEATIDRYLPTEIDITAKVKAKNSVLLLSESNYPGWRVYIDGKESKIRQKDSLFRGVELTKGKHQVKFIYDPLSFKLGAWVSLFTLLGMLTAGGFVYFRKNK